MSTFALALILGVWFIVGESAVIGGIYLLVDSHRLGKLVPDYGFILLATLSVPILGAALLLFLGW